MKYLALALLLVGCDIGESQYDYASVYPVREPFEYVMTTTVQTSNSYILREMEKACKSPFIITESKQGSGMVIYYFKCKVGR